ERRYDAATAHAELQRILASEATTDTAPARPAAGAATPRLERTTAVSLGEVAEEVRHEEAQAPVAPYPTEPPLPTVRAEPHTYAPPRVVPREPRRRRSAAPAILAVLALVLAAGLAVLLSSNGKGGGGTAAKDDPGTNAPQSSGDGGSADIKAAADVPDGWATHSDAGWTVAVPASYTPGSFNGFPQYKDRSTGRTLRVSTTAPGGGKDDAVKDREDQAAAFAAKHAGYHRIRIEKADYRGLEAADWEFTYADGGATLHAINRVFVVDGRGYSLFFQTRSTDDWNAAKADFDKIAATFQP
ncbi:MAG: eukaryotic-like serine/threonine-protein kinase, partial [Actinomycetota bacterium]|nr:eukaryotic-like serine/threonine-protein kinase [Actinomycetota bacterium]